MIDGKRLEKWELDCLRFYPFEGDRDVNVKGIRDGFLVARASHVCSICCDDIRRGWIVRAITETCDGQIGTFYFCPDCCRAMAAVIADPDGADVLTSRYEIGNKRCQAAALRARRAP